MKIKEVSQKTGLSKKTIRFYEEEGLIEPEKTYQNGRAYRTYTQAHIQTLNDVALLRRARFSVEEIKTILSTVRPPRLGGNTRMGVFATRSPFRPNAIGLSCVRLLKVEPNTPEGPVLTVAGADLMDGTPILDIKPYIPYADCQMEATGGFTDTAGDFLLKVEFPPELLEMVPEDRREALIGVLRHDPRPSYQRNAERVYGMEFAGVNVRFRVEGEVLTVIEVEKE